MIISSRYFFSIQSENFNPYSAEKIYNLKFESKNLKGEIGETGRYRGKEYPFGYGGIKISEDENMTNTLNNIIELVNELKKNTNEELDLDFSLTIKYENQCNLEIDSIFSRFVSELNIPLGITCYEAND